MSLSPEELTAGTLISPKELWTKTAAFTQRYEAYQRAAAFVEAYNEDDDLEKFGRSLKRDPEAAKALRACPSLVEGQDSRLISLLATTDEPKQTPVAAAAEAKHGELDHAELDHAKRTRDPRNSLER